MAPRDASLARALTDCLEAQRLADSLELDLRGEWRTLRLGQIHAALSALDLCGIRLVTIKTRDLSSLDLSCAWRLREFLEQADRAGAGVVFRDSRPEQLTLLDMTLANTPFQAPGLEESDWASEPVAELGRQVVRRWRDTLTGLAFLGRTSVTALHASLGLKHLRPASIARHVYETGITAIPIVALIAFLISVIIAYMSAQQLQRFGAEVFVVDLVTIGVLRELGVLLTSIVVAGRSGSAFAAEIGSMRLNEEVDALYATGVDPYEVLVLPRVLGLIVALPLLTIIADAIGITGGALLCHFLLGMPITQYLTRVSNAIGAATFWIGVGKAPVFAVLIAITGCYRGLQVRDSSRELGRLTTIAVVQAIFLVILADALFAVLFMGLHL